MKTARRKNSSRPAPARATAGGPSRLRGRSHSGVAKAREIAELRARLAEAEETLRAIRTGEVDTVMVAGKRGPQVFTLEGAESAYRVLIESMNEGALTLTSGAVILYANQCFARMVKLRLEQVIGASFYTFLSSANRAALGLLLNQPEGSGVKASWLLRADDGSEMPALISICPLAMSLSTIVVFGLVVTDMTEARHSEATLRDLARRLVQAQEVERGRVANELRVNITQLLYALLGRCESLAEKLPANLSSVNGDTTKIKEMLQTTAAEVEGIWRSLWSHELEKLGLIPALEKAKAEFVTRTGVSVRVDYPPLCERLPGEMELALFRILQKALSNIEQHAQARHVRVELTLPGAFVQLTIMDDGIGFQPDRDGSGEEHRGEVALLGMRERAAYVGGVLTVESSPRYGTKIEVRIPLPSKAPQ